MSTRIHLIAKRDGKLYSLVVKTKAVWQPLDAGDEELPDLLPHQYVELILLNRNGWSRYQFPIEEKEDA